MNSAQHGINFASVGRQLLIFRMRVRQFADNDSVKFSDKSRAISSLPSTDRFCFFIAAWKYDDRYWKKLSNRESGDGTVSITSLDAISWDLMRKQKIV